MLAAHADQENLVHNHQTTAAAKPMNQGTRGLGQKTPANKPPKTPFKIPLNDENAANHFGKSLLKTNGKGNENLFAATKKQDGKEKSAFITPAGPRTRAPLGLKTTNAKAIAFQTPGPPGAGQDSTKTQQKTVSPRIRRAKLKIHQAEPAKSQLEDDVPDIEYMAPKSIHYPDQDIMPHDFEYPDTKDLLVGAWSSFYNPIDENGLSRTEKQDAEIEAKLEKEQDAMLQKAIDSDLIIGWNVPEYPGAETVLSLREKRKEAEKAKNVAAKAPSKATNVASYNPIKSKGPPTLKAKSAASVLSTTAKPSFATPTTATKAKASSALASRKPPALKPTNPSPMRHAAATAASKTTLGYSKGRAVSATARKPLAEVHDGANAKASSAKRDPLTKGTSDKANKEPAVYGYDPAFEEWLRLKSFEPLPGELGAGGEDAFEGAMPELVDEEVFKEFVLDVFEE
ncbi:hypothetical protein LTR66_008869 [Elasticomyces elasticus]|nr:hypothetical protein LTR66_008869 [Elasticomyces elasticus]